MIYNVYAVRDRKSGFMSPVLAQSDDLAIRDFSYAVKNDSGLLHQYPADFVLCKLATFDNHTGRFENLPLIAEVADASSVFGD